MKPDARFANQPKAFWANVRTISETVGYTQPGKGYWSVPPGLRVPKNFKKHGGPRKSTVLAVGLEKMREALDRLHLKTDHMVTSLGKPTDLGRRLEDYFQYRAEILNEEVQPRLMDADAAKVLFEQCKANCSPTLPFVMNKQKGNKKTEAYLTCIVNMMIEEHARDYGFEHDPRGLTTITKDDHPLRTLARRLDGAFPFVVNPIAVWEIKEYYYTTTFGSRVADGVYETLLDGMELEELKRSEGIRVKHYLFADSHFTWWACGKSYLCRLVDMLHMGYADEILFGREVVDRLPDLVRQWAHEARQRNILPCF